MWWYLCLSKSEAWRSLCLPVKCRDPYAGEVSWFLCVAMKCNDPSTSQGWWSCCLRVNSHDRSVRQWSVAIHMSFSRRSVPLSNIVLWSFCLPMKCYGPYTYQRSVMMPLSTNDVLWPVCLPMKCHDLSVYQWSVMILLSTSEVR